MSSHKKSSTGGQHSFATVARAEIQRSSFNRNHGLKTNFDAGDLIPIFVEEVLPGDTMNMRMHTFARLATPLFPIMDNLYIDSHFFFVPNRLVWDNWEKFCGAQDDPGDSTSFLIPQIETEGLGVPENTVFDYMGLPIGIPNTDFSALPGRAMNLIWNEWFRDQNLQDSVVVNTGDGPDTLVDYEILKRGKRHDYFTSCLPFPQKGADVTIPLGETAPIVGTGDLSPDWDTATSATVRSLLGTTGGTTVRMATNTPDTNPLRWLDPKLEADLSGATAATINSLRLAFQVQRLLERDARGGSRYVESIKSHFGVTSPDFRLQRPEYLGGGTQNINITPVAQTSENVLFQPTGRLAGYGTSQGSNHTFQKSFTEHGFIIGFVSLRADLNYQQGMDRMWSRRTRYEHFWPALAHLGEQAVLNKEIYMDGSANDDLVFGYQERWAEYKYRPSKVTAQMRSANSVPLDPWHLAQEFGSLPTLGADFIEENPPIARIIATAGEPHLLFDAFFEYTCARPMPTFSTPGLIDHF